MAKYQSQFVPTDFNALGNILGMFRQDMQQRDQQFDQAQMFEQQRLAEVASMPSYDLEGRREMLSNLEQQMDQAVQRRGGDYGAAAKDLYKIAAKEKAKPWYQLNQRQLEQGKTFEQMMARNPNLMPLKDPRKMDLSKVQSPEELEYSVLDPAQVRQAALNLTKNLDTKRVAGIRTDPSGKYLIGVTQRGPSEEEVQELEQNPEIQEQLRSQFPQTQGMDSEELNQFFTNTLTDAARSYQRQPEERFLAGNPDYDSEQEGEIDPSNLVSVSKGRNINVTKGKPFETLEEVNSLDPSDPRWAVGQEIKENVMQQIPEDDRQLIEKYGSVEAVSEISEVTPDLPSPGNYFSKVLNDTGLLLSTLYSGLGVLAGDRAGTTTRINVPAMISVKDKLKKIKETKTPLDEYVQRKNNILEKYDLKEFPNRTARKTELHKIQRVHDRFKEKFNKSIEDEYSGVLGEFMSHDFLTGTESRDKATENVFDNLNKTVEKGQIPFESFEVISTNSDIDFEKSHQKLKEEDDEYKHISTPGNYRILEAWVDTDNLGPMYTIETDNEDGGVSHHVVTINNPEVNQRILRAFGKNNMPLINKETGEYYEDEEGRVILTDLQTNYDRFRNKELVKSRFESKFGKDFSRLPLFDKNWTSGNTIKDYLMELENDNSISQEDKTDIANYLMLSGLPLDAQLK